jgi:hypothetical protein
MQQMYRECLGCGIATVSLMFLTEATVGGQVTAPTVEVVTDDEEVAALPSIAIVRWTGLDARRLITKDAIFTTAGAREVGTPEVTDVTRVRISYQTSGSGRALPTVFVAYRNGDGSLEGRSVETRIVRANPSGSVTELSPMRGLRESIQALQQNWAHGCEGQRCDWFAGVVVYKGGSHSFFAARIAARMNWR